MFIETLLAKYREAFLLRQKKITTKKNIRYFLVLTKAKIRVSLTNQVTLFES